MNASSSEVLIELEAILRSNSAFTAVFAAVPVIPLAQDTNQASAYITFTNSMPQLNKNLVGIDGYDFHGFFLITCNVDGAGDKYRIHTVMDSLQRSILNDSTIWSKLVDRNLISVEYDNAEFYPKRSATLILEVIYRLTCN